MAPAQHPGRRSDQQACQTPRQPLGKLGWRMGQELGMVTPRQCEVIPGVLHGLAQGGGQRGGATVVIESAGMGKQFAAGHQGAHHQVHVLAAQGAAVLVPATQIPQPLRLHQKGGARSRRQISPMDHAIPGVSERPPADQIHRNPAAHNNPPRAGSSHQAHQPARIHPVIGIHDRCPAALGGSEGAVAGMAGPRSCGGLHDGEGIGGDGPVTLQHTAGAIP